MEYHISAPYLYQNTPNRAPPKCAKWSKTLRGRSVVSSRAPEQAQKNSSPPPTNHTKNIDSDKSVETRLNVDWNPWGYDERDLGVGEPEGS